jgi:membrane-anchored protein YejM (alkaline phosphatase superfamily)
LVFVPFFERTTMKNTIFFLFSLLLFSSCEFKKAPNKEALLEERLQQIDWTEVTRYPSVSFCDSLSDKQMQKDCFFSFLSRSVQEKLASDTLSILYPGIDTINVKVTIHPDATVIFEPLFTDSISYGKQKIDSIIQLRLQNFPKIEPAQKEGIPVKTEFMLPVVLKVE